MFSDFSCFTGKSSYQEGGRDEHISKKTHEFFGFNIKSKIA